ncbi:hypothetical protein CDD83_6557 [Cordyceps sp. RAO-2017]|nr:hypothetical protein CDD83_6557 [Cordyceps sp. RAO-2017]
MARTAADHASSRPVDVVAETVYIHVQPDVEPKYPEAQAGSPSQELELEFGRLRLPRTRLFSSWPRAIFSYTMCASVLQASALR